MNEPATIVEIDRDVCSRTFGVSPCLATGTKCYNTWATCAYTSAYAETVQTLRFVKPRADIPLSWQAVPSLQSVSTAPTELNVGDVDVTSGPLGKRAQASISLVDHPTSDILLDPYVSTRGVNPMDVGTFWGRLNARWPYHKGRPLRVLTGDITDALVDMTVREYIIDSIDGPDASGRVSIRAVDPLRLLDDKTAQAPAQSTGELQYDITSSQTSISVVGAVIADYAATGTLRIGSELMTYTGVSESSGVLTFTGLVRGSDGSVAADHKAEDIVQSCLRFSNVNAWEVARDLIQDYAQSAYPFIDSVQWSVEASQWLDGFIVSSVISAPTGLNTLLAELCRDAQFFIWWDERQAKILLRAVRPPTEVPIEITDNANIIAGSQSVNRKPDERISQVWYYYDPADASKSVTEESNYRKVRIRIDAEAETTREYGESAVKKIYSRWVRTDAIVTSITSRIINRYRDTPVYLSVSVDRKDGTLWTADVIDVSTRLISGFDGSPIKTRYQIVSADDLGDSGIVKYTMQTYNFYALYGYFMAVDAPIYSAATADEKLIGAWYADADGLISGDAGYQYQ